MSSGNGALVFEIYWNGELVRTEELTQDVIKIGKLPSSHLRLDDPNVSRIHAVIERSKTGEVHVIDLGSSRGTLVNGERINKVRLQSGDEIVLGQTKIVVKIPGAEFDVPTSGWGLSADESTQIGVQAMGPPSQAPRGGAGGSVQVHMPAPHHAAAPAAGGASAQASGYDAQGNWHDGQGGWYDPERQLPRRPGRLVRRLTGNYSRRPRAAGTTPHGKYH
jgi:predicted component of type VI protein secretion system